mgnify:CR=1 FL=1
MELSMNQANLGLGNGNLEWNLPDFGIQKYASQAVESIFHTIHSSFDYKGTATTRELITFIVFAVLLQGVLIPTESYTTVHANWSMMIAAGLTDLVACIIPLVALVWRWKN